MRSKKIVDKWLKLAGITINGDKSYDIQIKNDKVYNKVIRHGSLGFGEAYMDGWWSADDLATCMTKILQKEINRKKEFQRLLIFSQIKARLINAGRKSKSFAIGKRHYDIGNDLYKAMLDKRMTYTCGYWKKAKTLDEAQVDKLDLVCKKIGLKKGDRVLDIGSGWGSFLKYAAEKYGITGVGLTVSKEQKELADTMTIGLPVETRLQDYRDIKRDEKFDHIVSLGMFEHVGYKNYKTFFQIVARHLKETGLFLLHTIGSKRTVTMTDPWIEKYIFPNSMLPSARQIATHSEKLFIMEDWHNFGAYYDLTLMEWYKNVKKEWDTLKAVYDDRFFRMWEYYLNVSAASFRSRKNQLWQIVFSKNGVRDGYRSIR